MAKMFSTEYLITPGSNVVHIRRAVELRLAKIGALRYHLVCFSTAWTADYWVLAADYTKGDAWAVSGPHKTEQEAIKVIERLCENPCSL